MVFVLLIAAGMVFRRYWCRNICPMGAILALFSEWTLFKRAVSSSCTSCGLCVESCGMGAIESDGQGTKAGECILCMTCQKICPENSITFGDKQPVGQRYEVDLSKAGVSHNRLDQHGNDAIPEIELYKEHKQREDVYYPSTGRCRRKRFPCTLYTVRRVYEGLQDQWTAPGIIRGWN